MLLRRLANSLVFRLIGFGVLMVATGLAARLILLSGALQEDIREVVAAQQMALATYVAADIDGKVRARRQLLESVARELPPELLAQPKKLEAWLAERQSVAPLFSLGLIVIEPAGRGAIADFPALAGRRQLDFSASDWLVAARDQGRMTIGRPTPGGHSGEPILVMGAPSRRGDGQVVAIVAGATALATPGFLDLIQNSTVGKSGGFLLISPRDKVVVAASRPEMRLRPISANGVGPLLDRAMAGLGGTGITVDTQGVEELSAIASVPAADWFVVAHLPTEEAFQPVDRIRYLVKRNSSLIALAVVIFLVWYLTRVFRPMRDAARQMRLMADGKAPLAPLPIVRRDEIGEMTDGFNRLLEKLRDSEAQMAHLAHHDALTGLPNRLAFLDRIRQGTALARRQGSRAALLFIDLDGFKPINDQHGHEVGDRVLAEAAARLGGCVRQADTVARFGGDEFVVLLADIADRDAAGRVAQKCLDHLGEPYAIAELEVRIGASIGIALFPDDADAPNTLISRADVAMYDAKHRGRNCFRFADSRE
jgi:diguanylate cyclase (GGDEF)-like protein